MPLPFLLAAGAQTEVWDFLLKLLALLAAALLMGAAAERLRQSAIVGYLIAGTLIGPSVLGWVSDPERILAMAELGVAMLLFVIGLEFSPRQLLALGRVPLVAGPLQVVLTLAAGAAGAALFGLGGNEAMVIGSMVALSSTATVLRLLSDRAEIDSPHGRTTLGVLLIQDIAVIPLVLIVSVLAEGGTIARMAWQLVVSLFAAGGLILAFFVFFKYVIPPVLVLPTWRRNRDLPVLLAVVVALGAAWAAHWQGLSPALGAFVAGVLLAISPFATQIRADIQPLTTVLVTLFFASVGMLANLPWLIENLVLVGSVVLIVVVGKAAIVAALAWICGQPMTLAVAAGCCLAQVGEFAFVLAMIAQGERPDGPLIPEQVFRTLVSATIITLILTPYLVALAPRAGLAAQRLLPRLAHIRGRRQAGYDPIQAAQETGDAGHGPRDGAILLIGFGPAGQRVAEELLSRQAGFRSACPITVVDLNPENLEVAERYGLTAQLGDATQTEILEHAGIYEARAVVITVPTTSIVRQLIHLTRQLSPGVPVFARCRYHIHQWLLTSTGAHVVIDEESQVGQRLAEELVAHVMD